MRTTAITTKTILSIFVCVTVFMVVFSFVVPTLAAQPTSILAVAFLVAGLALAGILTLIILSSLKARPESIVPNTASETAPSVAPGREQKASDEKAVQMLSLLQKKGRLIDFLQEDISVYDDRQIGAAVRNIHKGCRDAVTEYVRIEPVMKETEGQEVTVREGFDPSTVRLTGNVIGSPPFTGTLRHSGWRVVSTSIPPIPKSQDSRVIEPAEVEIS